MSDQGVLRMRINGKLHTAASLDEISLKDLLLFDQQIADVGLGYRWSDVERLAEEFGKLKPEEINSHPDRIFFTAVTVWATLRVSGEDVTFEQAIATPIKGIEFLPPTADRAKAGPTKRAAQRPPAKKAPAKRAASARGGSPRSSS